MTGQEFVALTDREKDALVAEKVMGWTPVSGGWRIQTGQVRTWESVSGAPGFKPSTDIAAAWQVIAHMQATGHIATTEIDAGCGFTIGYNDLDGNEYGFHTVLLVNRAPLAICMAALQAKGFIV